MLLALLAVVPLTLDRVRLLENERTERIALAYNEASTLAKRGLDTQQEIVAVARGLLHVIARAFTVNSVPLAGVPCNDFLDGIGADIKWIRGLSMIDLRGRITCSTRRNAIGLDVSDRAYFKQTVSTDAFVLGDYLTERVNKGAAIVAGLPIKNPSGATQAVIASFIDLDWVGRLTGTVAPKTHAAVLLIDGKGTVLASKNNGVNVVGRDLAHSAIVARMLTAEEGTARGPGLDGVERIFGFVRLPGTDIHLAVGLNAEEILSRIEREINFAYAQFAFVILIVLLVTWVVGEQLIVEPIRLLARTAQRFGAGELDQRPNPKGWLAEFVPLVRALDDMAKKLANRERDLRVANRHFEELASVDSLSGLANRRSFDARLDVEWQRAMAAKRPLALLLIDVDHFKDFNDSQGHLRGDSCLRMLGRTLHAIAAENGDHAARYGGEEFALLVPGADMHAALAMAERVRMTIEGMVIHHHGDPCGKVTVSIGVASLTPHENDVGQDLIEAADAGLYAAKHNGRNCIAAYDEPIALQTVHRFAASNMAM